RWHAPLAVSALSGEGLDELRTALVAVAADLADRPVDDLFRLPIDRVFALAGAGTVVTGSTWSGTVKAGASVRLLPLGREVRVRSIEVHGEETDRAAPGRRTALALVGADKEELERGHVALTGAGWHQPPHSMWRWSCCPPSANHSRRARAFAFTWARLRSWRAWRRFARSLPGKAESRDCFWNSRSSREDVIGSSSAASRP